MVLYHKMASRRFCRLYVRFLCVSFMKIFSNLTIILAAFVFLCSCAHEPVDNYDFSSIAFSGTATVTDMPLPLQGVLTNKDGELKFVLTAAQGMVLGYGSIIRETGRIKVVFSQSSGSKHLLKEVGDALEDLIHLLANNLGEWRGWTRQNASDKLIFKRDNLELNAHLTLTRGEK